MTFEQLLSIITNISMWSIVKIFVLLACLLYIAFAWVVIRQVALMSKALDGMINLPLKLIARGQLILAVIVFLVALVIL